ncbi:MAG: hypothetical protein LBR10_15875, partial [Prevotellaceae bacterium]|nr:hypothetical protein [Prevotellaceae bacterium]
RYDNDGECMTNYFVHILETFDNGTIESLIEKYKTVFDFKDVAFETSKTVTNKVIVCLCFLKLKDTYVGKQQILFLNENNYQEVLTDLIKLRS